MKPILLAGSALVACMAAGGACAQVADAAAAARSTAVTEVIVTAQKHSERLQDVPMAVSAVSSSQLTTVNATKLLDIAMLVPGLSIVSQTGAPGSNTIDIRGISTADEASTTVATTVDDVPVNSSSANGYAGLAGLDLMPYLVSSVEVLKGPQGTLYGASSLGGLLKYVTPTPSLTQSSGSVGAEVSGVENGDQIGNSFRASGSMPIIPGQLAIDARFDHVFTPGYINDDTTGQRDFNHGSEDGGLIGVLWEPTAQFTAKLTAIVQESDYHGVSSILLNGANTGPAESYLTADYPLANANGSWQNTQLYSLSLTDNLGWATLTSVTGYSHLQSTFNLDISEASYDIFFGIDAADSYTLKTNKFTQEFRLAAPEGARLTRTAGVFYTNEDSTYLEFATPYTETTPHQIAQAFEPFYYNGTNSSFGELAGFGTVGYKITDAWDVSVGGRYAWNNQAARGFGSGFLNGGPYDTGVVNLSDAAFTYSADTRYRFTPDVMAYARIATGYRPGGSNFGSGIPASFAPDTTTNYEIGLKTEWLDHRLLADADVFYIDWKNIHILQRLPNLLDTYTGNAGGAVSDGVEYSFEFQLAPELKVGTNGAYIDATLRTADPAIGAVVGTPLPNSPKFTGTVFANWSHTLADGYHLNANASWLYVGSRMSDFPAANPTGVELGAYDTLDLSGGVSNDKWKVNVFLRNAGDEHAYLTRRNFGAVVLQPPTAGLSVDRSF